MLLAGLVLLCLKKGKAEHLCWPHWYHLVLTRDHEPSSLTPEETGESWHARIIQHVGIKFREATVVKSIRSGKIHPFCSLSLSYRKKTVSARLLWQMRRMHSCMCILGLFGFFFLNRVLVYFFPHRNILRSVLELTKYVSVHVLNDPSMHVYIWAEQEVGRHVVVRHGVGLQPTEH